MEKPPLSAFMTSLPLFPPQRANKGLWQSSPAYNKFQVYGAKCELRLQCRGVPSGLGSGIASNDRFVCQTEELIVLFFGKPETLSRSKPLSGPVMEKQKMLSPSFFPQH